MVKVKIPSRRTAQVFTVSPVLGTAEGERCQAGPRPPSRDYAKKSLQPGSAPSNESTLLLTNRYQCSLGQAADCAQGCQTSPPFLRRAPTFRSVTQQAMETQGVISIQWLCLWMPRADCESSPSGAASRLLQLRFMLKGELEERVVAVQSELLADARAVVFNSAVVDRQLRGNFLAGFVPRD